MGRPVLGRGEIRCMTAAANVERAYTSRARYKDNEGNANWVKWAEENRDLSNILNAAMRELDNE
jgi:hypothetical protein